MPDVLTEIQPLHMATATEASNQPFLMLPGGAPVGAVYPGRYFVRIQYFDALQASGSGTWQFSVLLSYTNGVTWVSNVSGAVITLTASAQDGQQVLQITPSQSTVNETGRLGVMVIATLGGSGVSPTLVYRADLLTM
jgi:hypothetical protein